MLYREIIAVCFQIHIKHINVELLNFTLCSKGVLSDGGHKEHVRLQRTTAMTSTPAVTQTSSTLRKTSATTKGSSSSATRKELQKVFPPSVKRSAAKLPQCRP